MNAAGLLSGARRVISSNGPLLVVKPIMKSGSSKAMFVSRVVAPKMASSQR